MLPALLSLLPSIALLYSARAQVTATGANGATNPSAPSFAAVGSTVNQGSTARLLSLNGVDDFCLWGPPTAGTPIGNAEAEVVAYCTKPRNGARLIPDGTIQSAHFVRTPLYVQISGLWDGTKANLASGDYGGELDPHGATGLGNPVGGNVTSNVSGRDVFYEEWMAYVAYDQFCFRICTAQTANVTAALECEHELDLLGCQWVMAIGDLYSANTFSACDGDPAYPPGLYPETNGSTSTFRQRYTGTYTIGTTSTGTFTVGQTITPSAPAYYPATSNCVTYQTISNGVNTNNYAVTASPQTLAGPSGSWSSAAYNYAIPVPSTALLATNASTSTSTMGNLISTSASASSSSVSGSGGTAAVASGSSSGSGSSSRSASPSTSATSSVSAGNVVVSFRGLSVFASAILAFAVAAEVGTAAVMS